LALAADDVDRAAVDERRLVSLRIGKIVTNGCPRPATSPVQNADE
jgi:hypothetical protein